MEPREADVKQIPQARPEEKKRRFRIVKLEERIAPNGGHDTHNPHCGVAGGGCSLSVE
jgi:hypothetical protein